MTTARCPSCHAYVGLDAPLCERCGMRFAPGAAAATPAGTPLVTMPTGRDGHLPAGTVVAGRFRIDDVIGTGGMGTVYRARHLGLDKTVCLKTLRPSLESDPTVVGRFDREAKAASRLDHPNSVQILDFGQDERGQLFIVMEYVPGADLKKVFEAGPPGWARVGHIVLQVLAALGRAHAMGIVHRDLKPENILVGDRPDQPDFVKVLDFGIAKLMDAPHGDITRPDLVCGTPEYMSPEQAVGREADARSDLYAVGVLLYQGLSGRLPFSGQSPLEVLQKQVNEPVPPLTGCSGKPPEPLLALILRALHKDPGQRPQTAEAFRMELAAALGVPLPHPTMPPPAGAAGATGPSASTVGASRRPVRRRSFVLGLVAIALAAVGVVALTYYGELPLPSLEGRGVPTGTFTRTEASRQLQTRTAALSPCVTSLSPGRGSGQPIDLSVDVTVEPDGHLTGASLPGADGLGESFATCVREEVERWRLPHGAASPVVVTVPWRFRRP